MTELRPEADRRDPTADGGLHPAWLVAGVTFVTLVGAAAFRSVPGVLMDPLHREFGWSHGTIGSAVAVNLVLFGLFSPFAAALMDHFGVRRVVVTALLLVAAGSGLTVFMTEAWQLVALWGVLVGVGTGSMSMAFVATVSTRWFVARRGLVSGILTAGNATGQLIFLPVIAWIATHHGWRSAAAVAAAAALAVVPLVLWLLRDHPVDLGLRAYGATDADPGPPPHVRQGSSAGRAVRVLVDAARTRTFWLLAGGFAICGMTTNGLIATHFVPAAHDHGMPATTAASLLAVVGIFDVAGTIASGWLTDRWDPRFLLLAYYALRGVGLLTLPALLAPHTHPSMWVFIIVYGLDWVATVPPTVAICRDKFGAGVGPIVFAWTFASHQVGAAIAAVGAGYVRDLTGTYDGAFYAAAGLCGVAAVLSVSIRPTAKAADPVVATT
ncbi:MFS transporter [Nocardioides marmoribigeumensis]|uniref:MFS family permease n=1 Tax=Nocardioides marmoribigeumensis TaxID=433649 RepID=A0ABU2BT94_9ACTN|nr:MFS transporter [Nocardioides marmoribigeumensis]MDR7361850.1 MFS family permease [Nocardioides marmoribigeumensis]